MEIARAADYALPAVRHTLHEHTPPAGGFQRGFHRFRARVHRQDRFFARKLRKTAAEFAEQFVMECARRQRDLVQLRFRRGDNLGVPVPEIERAVRGEHIEVFPAVRVAHAGTGRLRDDDFLGAVIMSAVFFRLRDYPRGNAALFSFRGRKNLLHRRQRIAPYETGHKNACVGKIIHLFGNSINQIRTKSTVVHGFSYSFKQNTAFDANRKDFRQNGKYAPFLIAFGA